MKNLILLISLFISINTIAGNLHLIEEKSNGFSIYRTGKPDAKDMKELCEAGIEEIMVLSGNAQKYEIKNQDACPTLKVIYNVKQKPKNPVSISFLDTFDQWVTNAIANGKKIAFRCNCGCHRTGRLAAYYQMKYQGLTVVDATKIMFAHGKRMRNHPYLKEQVIALNDFIKGKSCSQEKKYCVQSE